MKLINTAPFVKGFILLFMTLTIVIVSVLSNQNSGPMVFLQGGAGKAAIIAGIFCSTSLIVAGIAPNYWIGKVGLFINKITG